MYKVRFSENSLGIWTIGHVQLMQLLLRPIFHLVDQLLQNLSGRNLVTKFSLLKIDFFHLYNLTFCIKRKLNYLNNFRLPLFFVSEKCASFEFPWLLVNVFESSSIGILWSDLVKLYLRENADPSAVDEPISISKSGFKSNL